MTDRLTYGIKRDEASAPHGGSSRLLTSADVKAGADSAPFAQAFERFMAERGVLAPDGHGQDPAQDGAQRVPERPRLRSTAPLVEKAVAEHVNALRSAGAAERASGETIDYGREHAALMAWATERRRTMPIFREPLALRGWEP